MVVMVMEATVMTCAWPCLSSARFPAMLLAMLLAMLVTVAMGAADHGAGHLEVAAPPPMLSFERLAGWAAEHVLPSSLKSRSRYNVETHAAIALAYSGAHYEAVRLPFGSWDALQESAGS